MKKFTVIAFSLFFICSWLCGCNESDCSLVTNSMARFAISDQHGNALKFTNNITISAITQADVTRYDTLPDGSIKDVIVYDSLLTDTLINQEAIEGSFSIPLSYNDYTAYVLHYEQNLRDTIRVNHINRPYFTDLECSALMFYEVKEISYTRHMLDSVIVTNAEINNYEKENFKIYYTVNQ